MSVRYAFALTAVPANCPGLLERADAYINSQGGVRGLRRRYGADQTLVAPILTAGALARLIPWRKVPSLPFERLCLPERRWKSLRLPFVSVAAPAMAAVGLARYVYRKPRNPVTGLLRRFAIGRALSLVESWQPESGGFLESVHLTSFAVMSLASIGRADHPVVQRGVEFLLATVRPDGSWPIGAERAMRNTALAVAALATAGEDVREINCLDWILACQRQQGSARFGAEPGGWSWTDRAGGAPTVNDTSSALVALAAWAKADPASGDKISASAAAGVRWLLGMHDDDGGWPMFARGWQALAADRSSADVTAGAVRALNAWRAPLATGSVAGGALLDERVCSAIDRGLRYLSAAQRPDGSWGPGWFGEPYRSDEENPVSATALVLAAYRDLNRLDNTKAAQGLDWLTAAANADGSWGAVPDSARGADAREVNVENTALAVETLLSCARAPAHEAAARRGLSWLVDAVEANRHHGPSAMAMGTAPAGSYERLAPLISAVAALGRAARRPPAPPTLVDVVHSAKT
jgi:squalene-hopene/tetraprenyl-beta-curcumene cyclase